MSGERTQQHDHQPDGREALPAAVAALVRPAPPEWRRAASLVAVVALVWLAAMSTRPVTGGGNGGMSWERGQPVQVEFSVANSGLLPVEIVGAVAPPGVRRVTVVGAPVRLGPWEGRTVRIRAEVGNCRELDRYERGLTLRVRNLPVGWTRDARIEVPFGGAPPDVDGTGGDSVGATFDDVVGGPEQGWFGAVIDSNCPA